MRRRSLTTATATVAAAFALVPLGHAAPTRPQPVPSLTPAATAKLWHRLVARRHPRSLDATADCRRTRAIFYAATDWLRLATKLAQNASPCATYYVSVPPLTGDKTQPRPGQAAQIRALGPNFHAMAEISYSAWSRWVTANSSDWFTAGVTARQRMAQAGYDVFAGDTWAMNEASTAVRKNTGAARSNLEEFLRGLWDGGGTPVEGIVFVVGQSQGGDQSAYKVTLQAWLQDSAFWSTVQQYVSDWLQETYGDVRTYAVAGTSPQQRRDQLIQYLGHPLALANAGGDASAAARAFLVPSYGPLANAAWAWQTAYGWTNVTLEQMEDYVSAQAYAMHALAAFANLPVDRVDYAWAPSNTLGLSNSDFGKQTSTLLDRLGQAVHDSTEITVPGDPGVGACGPPGQNLWCQAVLPGAAFTNQWAAFSTWTQTALAFANQPLTVTAGAVAGPLTVQLKTGGVVTTAMQDTPVNVTTTSAHGGFATSPAGPFTPTITVTIPAGQSSANVYYQDIAAGTPTVYAAQPGQPPATQTVTVVAGDPVGVSVEPRAATVVGGQKKLFAAHVVDKFGNPSTAPVTWRLSSGTLGTLEPPTGGSTTFTASPTAAGRGRLTATVAGLTSTALLTVQLAPARIGGTLTRRIQGHLVVTVWVVRGAVRAKGVPVSLIVRRGSSVVAQVSGRTDAHGRFVWRSKNVLPAGRYQVKAAVR